jgi:hypothetical protein
VPATDDILRFGIVNPYDKFKPFPAQQRFLEFDRGHGEVKRFHLIGGRGVAKTTTGILGLADESLVRNPGIPNIWTEPTYKHCKDVFLREFRQVVPSALYKLHKADMCIEWITGTITDIRSRAVNDPSKEINKGPNYGSGWEDEIAYRYDKTKYWDIDAAIRHPKAKTLLHVCMTTPKMNGYYDLVHSDGHEYMIARSRDNPHLPEGWVEERSKLLDERQRLQELEAEWVNLTEQLWYNYSSAKFPDGNTHPHKHNYDEPYYLAFDIGVATSAWAIIQPVSAPGYTTYVVTGEYTPRAGSGSVDDVLQRIKQDYGTPSVVITGADVNTRSQTDAKTPKYFIKQHFGFVNIRSVSGWIADKTIQLNHMNWALRSSDGKRRFCISEHLVSHDGHLKPRRGITEVMLRDVWPEYQPGVTRITSLPKEGWYEHMRDAILYFMVSVQRPNMRLHYAA